MAWLLLLLLTFNHWLFTPLMQLAQALLELHWLAWVLLALGLWLFAGAAAPRLEAGPLQAKPGSGPNRPGSSPRSKS
jgi:hypothetical protein